MLGSAICISSRVSSLLGSGIAKLSPGAKSPTRAKHLQGELLRVRALRRTSVHALIAKVPVVTQSRKTGNFQNELRAFRDFSQSFLLV
jgi:hypothetical protein